MSAGKNTIGSVLKAGASAASIAQISKIKTYPELFGVRQGLETTDLEDEFQTWIGGVGETPESLDFTFNHDMTAFAAYNALGDDTVWELDFGTAGADGKFSWKGGCSVTINEGAVNGLREMTLHVYPSTEIKAQAASEAFSGT